MAPKIREGVRKALKVEITLMIVLCSFRMYGDVCVFVCECLYNIFYRLALCRILQLPPTDRILHRIHCRWVVHGMVLLFRTNTCE